MALERLSGDGDMEAVIWRRPTYLIPGVIPGAGLLLFAFFNGGDLFSIF